MEGKVLGLPLAIIVFIFGIAGLVGLIMYFFFGSLSAQVKGVESDVEQVKTILMTSPAPSVSPTATPSAKPSAAPTKFNSFRGTSASPSGFTPAPTGNAK